MASMLSRRISTLRISDSAAQDHAMNLTPAQTQLHPAVLQALVAEEDTDELFAEFLAECAPADISAAELPDGTGWEHPPVALSH
jgi:hypothetical protein